MPTSEDWACPESFFKTVSELRAALRLPTGPLWCSPKEALEECVEYATMVRDLADGLEICANYWQTLYRKQKEGA